MLRCRIEEFNCVGGDAMGQSSSRSKLTVQDTTWLSKFNLDDVMIRQKDRQDRHDNDMIVGVLSGGG